MTDNQTIKDRLIIWINYLNVSVSAFERKCGLSTGYVANLKPNTNSKKINDILAAYPELNKEWLLTGEGEMLKNENPKKLENEDPYIVPLIPDSVLAGPLPDFSAPVFRDRCERVHVPVPDCDFAIQISGDSMAPEYKPGDYIAVSRINDRRFIPYSTPLLLDTTEGAILKCIEPGDDPDCLSAVSLNPHYLPYPVPKDIIRGIYRIKAVIRIIKTM